MNKYIYSGCLLLFSLMLMNCSDMNDDHQKYLDEGEIIYSAKADTIIVWTGHNRQRLEIEYNSGRLASGTVYWNNNTESMDFDFPQPYTAPLFVELPDMREGDYTYSLVTFDKYGNKSIPEEFNGKVYGESYITSLSNKVLSESSVTTEDGITFTTFLHFRQAENAVGMKLFYTNKNGKNVELNIDNNQLEILLEDNVQGSEFSYTTYFVPDSMCIDVFEAIPRTAVFPVFEGTFNLNRSDWEIIDFSSEEPREAEWGGGGQAHHLLDGDWNTFWHNQWDGYVAPLPHHITIDMKKEYNVAEIQLVRRLGNTNLRAATIELSMDNVTYTEAGIIDYGDEGGDSRMLEIQPTVARYIKIVVTESNNAPHASIAEVYVKGAVLIQ